MTAEAVTGVSSPDSPCNGNLVLFFPAFYNAAGAAPSPPSKLHSCSSVGQSVSGDGTKSLGSKPHLLHRWLGSSRTFHWSCLSDLGVQLSGKGWGPGITAHALYRKLKSLTVKIISNIRHPLGGGDIVKMLCKAKENVRRSPYLTK